MAFSKFAAEQELLTANKFIVGTAICISKTGVIHLWKGEPGGVIQLNAKDFEAKFNDAVKANPLWRPSRGDVADTGEIQAWVDATGQWHRIRNYDYDIFGSTCIDCGIIVDPAYTWPSERRVAYAPFVEGTSPPVHVVRVDIGHYLGFLHGRENKIMLPANRRAQLIINSIKDRVQWGAQVHFKVASDTVNASRDRTSGLEPYLGCVVQNGILVHKL